MSAARPPADERPGGTRAYHRLAALPAVGMLGGVPFANRVEPFVLGLPFLLFWILAWVVATSGTLGVIYALDQAHARRTGAAAEPANGGGRP